MPCMVSIIVPQYKTEKYICRCVDSILSQTLEDIEVILVNDGSPDRCGEICDQYSRKDNRVKVIHKENGGYSSAINAGLDIAQGEFIGIVDGDDYIDKDMYMSLYNLACRYEADIVECNVLVVRDNDMKPVCKEQDLQFGDNLFALEKLMRRGWNSVLWNKLYKRDLFSRLRLPYGKVYSDSWVVYKLFFSVRRYVYTGDCRYFYIRRDSSVMGQQEYSIKRLEGLDCHSERFYYLKDRINEQAILDLTEYSYFYEILVQYYLLSINRNQDPNKKYRKMARQHILANYDGFKKNKLLKKYRIWMILVRVNGTLFEISYKLYIPVHDWFYNIRCKFASTVKKYITNT